MQKNNIVLAVVALLCLLVVAEPSMASDTINGTIRQYDAAAQLFGSRVQNIGVQLLFWLFGLQIIINAIKWTLKSADIGEIAVGFVWPLLSVGFFYLLIHLSGNYLPNVIAGFVYIGKTGSGLGQLSPSAIFQQGIDLQDVMVQYFNTATGADQGLFAALKNFGPAVMLSFACIVILISFAVLAWQMALAMIGGYFWMAITPVLLGFGGITFTRDFAVSALKGGVSVGMKLTTVYLVAGVAGTLAPLWGDGMKNITLTDWSPIWHVVFGAGLLAYLSFQLPKLASDLLNGTSSLSAGDAASNMAMAAAAVAATVTGVGAAAGAAVGAAGGAAGAIGKAASGLSKALAAGSEPGSISKASGAVGGAPASSAPAAAPSAGGRTPQPAAPQPAPDYATAERIAQEMSNSSMGDASTASIGGGSPTQTQPTAAPTNKPRLHERIRDAGHQMPQDATSVGLNANISSHIGD